MTLGPSSFAAVCRAAGLPEPVAEYPIDKTRKWRADYCWPAAEHRLILEVQGGLFIKGGGRHNRGAALVKEYEKLNAACCLGYRVLFITPEQMKSGAVVDLVAKALAS
jgi:hypothetical protein